MRAPAGKGQTGQSTWWSSPADSRAVRDALSKLRGAAEKAGKELEGEGLLEIMAADGSKFGTSTSQIMGFTAGALLYRMLAGLF